jgi:hypothetical protein
MPDAKSLKSGQRFYLHVIPPERTEPIRDEDIDTLAEAEERQRELEAQGCRVTLTPVNVIDPMAPQTSIAPKVKWVRVTAVDVIGAAKTLGTLGALRRFTRYSGLDVTTLLSFGSTELAMARDVSGQDRARHAINAVHYAKMTLDCLTDAYLARDYLTERLRPLAGFIEKLKLVRKRLGEPLVPATLISMVVADPRDVAQHERIAPSFEQAEAAVQAARMIVEATTRNTDPLDGPALTGWLAAGFNDLPGHSRSPYVLSMPAVFGLLWRGRDNVARAGVGQGNQDAAEIQYAELIADFTEEQHLELLRLFDASGAGSTIRYSEASVRELLTAAGLDAPP